MEDEEFPHRIVVVLVQRNGEDIARVRISCGGLPCVVYW